MHADRLGGGFAPRGITEGLGKTAKRRERVGKEGKKVKVRKR